MRSIYSDMKQNDESSQRESSFTFFDRYIFRPLGLSVAAYLYTFLSIRPNQLTLFSVMVTIVGCVLLNLGYPIFAFGFLLLFPVLDCADGSLARYLYSKGTKTTDYGDLVDAMGGYSFILVFWLSLGLYYDGAPLISFLCNLTCALNLISRLYYNKRKIVMKKCDPSTEAQASRSSRLYNLYENLEFGSAMLPLAAFMYFLSIFEYFVLIYFALAASLFMWCLKDLSRTLK